MFDFKVTDSGVDSHNHAVLASGDVVYIVESETHEKEHGAAFVCMVKTIDSQPLFKNSDMAEGFHLLRSDVIATRYGFNASNTWSYYK